LELAGGTGPKLGFAAFWNKPQEPIRLLFERSEGFLTEPFFSCVLVEYMGDDSQDQLLQQLRAGEAAALDRLWRDNRRWLAVVLLAHMPREGEIEDLLQEVALKVMTGIKSLEDPAKLRPWLRKVACNTALSAGRKAGLRRRILRRLETHHQEIADPRSERGLASFEASLAARRALEAAKELPPEYREPLLLRVLEGMSQRKIAESLELPETTIESRLVRARRLLRQKLDARDATASIAVARQGD
jgi:RNA polymerase sigma factor (sigma-70 family)